MQCFRTWLRAKTINGFCLERRKKGKVQSCVSPNANSLFECMCLCVVLTAINSKLELRTIFLPGKNFTLLTYVFILKMKIHFKSLIKIGS